MELTLDFSPNACGCIALLVSALKREQASYTPYRLKNAVVQSAKSVDDPLNVGFIQVDKAWEYLKEYKDRKDLDLMFEVGLLFKDREIMILICMMIGYCHEAWKPAWYLLA